MPIKNKLKWMLKRLGIATEFFAPRRCPLCGKIVLHDKPEFWCESCWEQALPWIRQPFCHRCGAPFDIFPDRTSEDEVLCGECLSESPAYDMIRSACAYDGIAAKLITALKYGKRLFYVPPLVELLEQAFTRWLSEESIDLIIPVPLHEEKLKERGFNQSLLLAKELAKKVAIPISYSVLIKVRKTPPQATLHKTERKKNLQKAFAISSTWKEQLRNASVLVVDDVITTGTTIQECAKVLKGSGAAKVIGLSVARTPS